MANDARRDAKAEDTLLTRMKLIRSSAYARTLPWMFGATLLAACSSASDTTEPHNYVGGDVDAGRADSGGTSVDSGTPPIDGATVVDASAPTPQVLTSHWYTTCATGADNKLRCWGSNVNGVAGNGAGGGNVATATLVKNLSETVVDATVGYLTTCAVTSAGAVKCWGGVENGSEGSGFLGNPNEKLAAQPASALAGDLTPLSNVKQMASSYYIQCAVKNDKSVWCFGVDNHGEFPCASAPVSFTGTSGSKGLYACKLAAWANDSIKVTSASNSQHCVLSSQGKVQCWAVGDPANVPHTVMTQDNKEFSGAVDLVQSDNHWCALMPDATVQCWGTNNAGQLGLGNKDNKTSPTPVPGLTGVKAIFAGGAPYDPPQVHTCALMKSGQLKCWGSRTRGQLGDGVVDANNPALSPIDVPGLTDVTQASLGREFTCVRRASGKVQCFGASDNNALGSAGGDSKTPRDVTGF